jgi:two-component system, NtrC family, response regulator GlrR
MQDARILLVDDDPSMREVVTEALSLEGARVSVAAGLAEARQLTAKESYQVLITDVRMPDGDGMELVREVRARAPDMRIIVITAYPDQKNVQLSEELEVSALLTKPFTLDQIKYAVLCALENIRVAQTCATTAQFDGKNDLGITGVSEYARNLRRQIGLVATADFPVLIEGDSGTGKEVIAKAIHGNSSRKEQLMIIVNCAAIPKHLEEAEFFGHARGAFTGATQARIGIIATADKSTLFLDEVGDMSPGTQAKLLRVLENMEYQRLGENELRKADIRVISATNRNLQAMVADGRFREDLYYRLRGDVIAASPLAGRTEDIPSLVRHFLQTSTTARCPNQITAEVIERLVNRPWPGNIRELKHFVHLLCHRAAGAKRINMAILEEVEKQGIAPHTVHSSYKDQKKSVENDFDAGYFRQLLQKHSGNLNRASKEAGIDHSNLIKKLRALGISADEFREGGETNSASTL